ncbi:hypothetical protein J6590_027099 [Homalodisca vitripennis]|nr:hypothetical protein J6590_027099 [Homalodisca vitripennis]
MLRVRECVLLFLILGSALSLEDKELKNQELDNEVLKNGELDEGSFRRNRGFFSDFFGSRSNCGDPENCPPHACRLDDAVVHGFCCGCAKASDRVPIKCPPWLQCPISPIPLCNDYNYMMDCCC